ncbi:kinase-like domain-containing protein [Aspergillus filifer]
MVPRIPDIHLSNILVKLPSIFDDLSIEELYKKYGDLETIPITRCDGEPLPQDSPAKATKSLFLGQNADKFTLSDAHPLLSDFGEAFSPASETLLGEDSHTPPGFRPPEAKFEPQSPLSFPSDIWSLATAIWEIVGVKRIFSNEYIPQDEVIAQHSYKINKWPPPEEWFEVATRQWSRKEGLEIEKDEVAAFLDLMRRMLAYRPEDRLTAEEVLRSEWMVKWALPCYERQ